MFVNSHFKEASDQKISIPTVLLSYKDGALSPALGPRRSLISQFVSTGQWARQCFENFSLQWLATVVSEELSHNKNLQSILIQTGDGNELFVLINDAKVPESVTDVELMLTAVVAVGTTADVESGFEGTIKPSDQLWPFVALAKEEDQRACVFVWIVRDASLAHHPCTTTFVSIPQKQKALRLSLEQKAGQSTILVEKNDVTDLPKDFWKV